MLAEVDSILFVSVSVTQPYTIIHTHSFSKDIVSVLFAAKHWMMNGPRSCSPLISRVLQSG